MNIHHQMWGNFDDLSIQTRKVYLHRAVQYDDREVIQRILDTGLQLDYKNDVNGNAAIHLATMNVRHDYEVIALLIAKGADVNSTNRHEKTPLHLALERDNCNLKVIKLLLESRADVNMSNVSKSSALHFAVQNAKCEIEVLDMLLDHGAQIDAVNCVGDTPLLRALRNPSCTVGVIAWLLKHGANIKVTNLFGRSALHSAVENRYFNLDILKLLLMNEVPLDICNSRRKSPLYLAIENHCNPAIVQALLDAGAMIDYGDSTFEMAIEICDKTWHPVTMENLELLVRYATLRSLDYDIERYIKTSKFYQSLFYLKNSCRQNVMKMDSREILPGVTFRDFVCGRKRLRFNSSTTEGELYNLVHIFHIMAVDQYLMYTSIIASKIDIRDLCDNLKLYSTDSDDESKTVWLDCDSTAHVVRYLSKDDVFNLMIAFHTAEVCTECSG